MVFSLPAYLRYIRPKHTQLQYITQSPWRRKVHRHGRRTKSCTHSVRALTITYVCPAPRNACFWPAVSVRFQLIHGRDVLCS